MAHGTAAQRPYPAHWEADVVLRDGSTMHIRPVRPEDADALQEMHVGQSEQSMIYRFFAPRGRLSDEELHRFTHVDHRSRVALVLMDGDALRAVGRFDVVEPGEAEVAFYVSDALHGLGLGSVLLEHLAAAGRELGVRTFVADVLPGNGKMIHVFKGAGFPVQARTEDGVLSIRLGIEETGASWTVRAERERRTESVGMARVLGATSVLVGTVGGSAVTHGHRVLVERVRESVGAGGFDGEVHLVDGIEGGDGATVFDERVDLAVLAGPPEAVVAAVPALERLGVRGLVVLSGGFAETGPEGAAAQDALLRATRAAGMRLFGPASHGLLVTDHGKLDLLAVPPGRPRIPGATAGVGLFGQSAESTHLLVTRARSFGVPLASVVSGGNRADVSGNDTMQWWTVHEPTRVGLTYLESIGNPRKFSRIARRLSRTTPLVTLVAGTTGRAAPPGHRVRTSRRPARVLDELLRQAGVLRPGTMSEAVDLVAALVSQPPLTGDKVAVVASSVGFGGFVADLLRVAGLQVSGITVLDPGEGAASFEAPLARLAAEAGHDAVLVALSEAFADVTAEHAAAVARASAGDGRPWLVVDETRKGLTADYTVVVGVAGEVPGESPATVPATLPAVATSRAAVRVLAHLAERAAWLRSAEEELVEVPGLDPAAARGVLAPLLDALPPGGTTTLDPAGTAALLGAYGIDVLPATPTTSAAQAAAVAAEVGGPVVLKVDHPVLSRRSSLGGLRLDVDPGAVAEAWESLAARDAARRGGEPVILVQASAPRGVACTVRVGEDELYGPVVAFGLSGDATELLDDISYRVPPLTAGDVAQMVRSVRGAPRLLGEAGLPAADLAAVEDLLARASELADDLPEVLDCVLDPVIVSPDGLVVAGAVVTVARTGRQDTARRVLPASDAGSEFGTGPDVVMGE